jgi:hypothetical protein
MLRRTTRRPGVSLVEVLVGFGILGIGITSVITLFPFSALTMGQALRDDRTTTCATIADGELRDIHQRYVIEPGDGSAQEVYHFAMDNPGTTLPGQTAPLPGLSSGDSGPSYPVYVDPMGYYARLTGSTATPVGDAGQTGIPRVNLQMLDPTTQQVTPLTQQTALRYCSLMDSLTFDGDGNVPNTFDMRELRYNFAWMLQRPVNRDRYTVRMQVVVYNKRAHLYAPPGGEAVLTGVTFIPGETFITVPSSADVRKGGWVMDGTVGADGAGRPLRHAEFYRIQSVTDQGATLTLELHKPVARADGLSNPANTSAFAYSGTLVSMPGVADVFDRPYLTKPQP